jgi:snRNA-activating protein complex subunit 1
LESEAYHLKFVFPTEECKKLKDFVAMAKQNGVPLVPVLVKRMLDKGLFLFGFINLLGDNGEKQVEELTAAQNKRVKFSSDTYVSFLSLVLV